MDRLLLCVLMMMTICVSVAISLRCYDGSAVVNMPKLMVDLDKVHCGGSCFKKFELTGLYMLLLNTQCCIV